MNTKKTLKISSLLCVVMISLWLSGCGQTSADTTESTDAIVTSFAASSASVTTEMKTIEPPENGWTMDELNQVTYFCGEPFTLPCKLRDIEDKLDLYDAYELDVSDNYSSMGKFYAQDFDYNGILFAGSLEYYVTDNNEKIVYSLTANMGTEDMLVINGFNITNRSSDIISQLGEADTSLEKKHIFKIASNDSYPDREIIICPALSNEEELVMWYYQIDYDV